MIISIDAAVVFDKIQYLLLVKAMVHVIRLVSDLYETMDVH